MRTLGVVTLVVAGLAITMLVVAVCMGWLSDSLLRRNALACLLVLHVLTLLGFTVATLVYLVIFTLNFIDLFTASSSLHHLHCIIDIFTSSSEPCEGHSHLSKMRAMVIFMWAVWAVSVSGAASGAGAALHFAEEQAAARAFDDAARQLRGNRAHGGGDRGQWRLNFPTEAEAAAVDTA